MININDENNRYSCNMPKTEIKSTYINSYEKSCLNIGDIAPTFSANTTYGEFNLLDYRGKWLVFFSHPGDFTPVCTTEFISFTKYHSKFKKRNCELLGLSVDNITTHLAWVADIYKTTGIKISFPIIEDKDSKISKMYNMLDKSGESTSRSVYIICPEGKIKAIINYPKTTGRNIGEILRLVEALQEAEINNVATPANWIPGLPTISRAPKTQEEMLKKLEQNNEYNCVDWFLCFNKTK